MNPTQSEVVAIVGVVDWWPENVPVLPRNRSSRAFVRRLSFTTKAACGASLVSVWLFYNGDEIAVVPAAFRKGGACMATVEGGAHCYPEFDPAVCINHSTQRTVADRIFAPPAR